MALEVACGRCGRGYLQPDIGGTGCPHCRSGLSLADLNATLLRIERLLSVQADEWVLCPDCRGRGERNFPSSRGEPMWLPCSRCAKLGRVRKETVDA